MDSDIGIKKIKESSLWDDYYEKTNIANNTKNDVNIFYLSSL